MVISNTGVLLDAHRKMLEEDSGISPEVIAARGYFSAASSISLENLDFSKAQQNLAPALVIPVHNVAGSVAFHRIRPDTPRSDIKGKPRKYEQPAGIGVCIDVPPSVRPKLSDPSIPLIITEGEKKADCAISRGGCCIALLGVWGWKGQALSDWDSITLKARIIYICFDSDAKTNNQVMQALKRLCAFLQQRGATVLIVDLPDEGRAKTGLDDFLVAGHLIEEVYQLATVLPNMERAQAKADENDPRSVIEVNGTAPRDVVAESIKRLAEYNDRAPHIFKRDTGLYRVNKDADGRPVIVLLEEKGLSVVYKQAARFISTSNDRGEVEVLPPQYVLNDTLSQDAYPQFPPLDGVVSAPIFANNGTLCDKTGYHPVTRKYYHSPTCLEDVPRMSVAEALRFLRDEWLYDFPFDSKASYAHAISLALLPFVRNMIDGQTPLFLLDAPTPGSGKTLLATVLAYPFVGSHVMSMAAPTEEAEWSKAILSMLLVAPSHILIDNVRGVLGSPTLESCLTKPEHSGRLLGGNRTVTFKTIPIWMASSNNAEVHRDLLRRSIQIRLDPQTENPSERDDFKHSDLVKFTKQNRARLVSACISIVQKWIDAGQPPYKARRVGSFESWGEVMGGILQVAGVDGFLSNREDMLKTIDPSNEAWRTFIEAWFETKGLAEVSVKDLFEIAKSTMETEIQGRDGNPSSVKFGLALRKMRGRVFGGKKIEHKGVAPGGAQKYQLQRTEENPKTPNKENSETNFSKFSNDCLEKTENVKSSPVFKVDLY